MSVLHMQQSEGIDHSIIFENVEYITTHSIYRHSSQTPKTCKLHRLLDTYNMM